MSKDPLNDRNAVLEALAAELTSAAYSVLLRAGLRGSWVELELGLWKVLAETVGTWARKWPRSASPDDFANWREGLVAGLTDGAVFVAREQAVHGPPPQVRSRLREAFRSAISRAHLGSPGRPVMGGCNS